MLMAMTSFTNSMRGRQSCHDSSSHKACQLLDEKFTIALHEIKNQRIRHKQHVANTSKPEPIQCFWRKPWLLTVSLKAYSCKPPDFPPFPCLNSLIGAWSKPFKKQLAFSYVKGDDSKLSLNKLDVENSLTIAKQERSCW